MKKLLVLLMVLAIAAPSMAAVTLTQSVNNATKTATIGYSYDGTGGFPRAFALTVTANNSANITAVTATKTDGQSTAASKGYGIFPGTITINPDGTVPAGGWGTPVEPNQLHNTGKSLVGTNQVICALGSLYGKHAGDSDANKPANSGNLFTVAVNTGCTLTVTPESTYRGGVVDENAQTIAVSPINVVIQGEVAPNAPTGVAGTRTLTDKVTVSWIAPSGTVTGYDVYRATNSTPGGTKLNSTPIAVLSFDDTTAVSPTFYYYYVKAKNSAGDSAYSAYNKNCIGIRSKASWANTNWDLSSGKCPGHYLGDGTCDGKVNTLDLNLIKANAGTTGTWLKSKGQAGYDCKANMNLSGAVNTLDLNIVKANWLVSGLGGTLVTTCPATE